jgi:hypothetical protein
MGGLAPPIFMWTGGEPKGDGVGLCEIRKVFLGGEDKGLEGTQVSPSATTTTLI